MFVIDCGALVAGEPQNHRKIGPWEKKDRQEVRHGSGIRLSWT